MSDPIIGTVGAISATADQAVLASADTVSIRPDIAVTENEVVSEEALQDVEAAPVAKRAARSTAPKKT